jgi:dGTP triphosphohydrolase
MEKKESNVIKEFEAKVEITPYERMIIDILPGMTDNQLLEAFAKTNSDFIKAEIIDLLNK